MNTAHVGAGFDFGYRMIVVFNPWVRKIPWRRESLPTAVFFPGEFLGQMSLVGQSPWSYRESDMTEHAVISMV